MISKLKSARFAYVLLCCLGSLYIGVDNYVDRSIVDMHSYSQTMEIYEDYLDQSISQIKEKLNKYIAIKDVVGNGTYENQEKISTFYNRLDVDNSLYGNLKLKAAIEVVQPNFMTHYYDGVEVVGLDVIDLKSMYLSYMHSYFPERRGCWNQPYRIVTDYYERIGMYGTQVVKDIMPTDYVLIYKGVAYSINPTDVFLMFTESEIEQGYAEVTLRNQFTLEDRNIKVNIPKYAFGE